MTKEKVIEYLTFRANSGNVIREPDIHAIKAYITFRKETEVNYENIHLAVRMRPDKAMANIKFMADWLQTEFKVNTILDKSNKIIKFV